MIIVINVCPTIDNNHKGAPLCTPIDNITGLSPPNSFRNIMVNIWFLKLYSLSLKRQNKL